VRNAFRATLRDEPSGTSLISTQELDAADVLEVTDLANAIARAEEVIRARSSSRALLVAAAPSSSGAPDIFDALVEAKGDDSSGVAKAATDDIAGSAQYAPYIPTPIPAARVTPVPPPPKMPPPPAMPRSPVPKVALPVNPDRTQPLSAMGATMMPPILVLDEDAFYHPAGRIRGFADVTIEGYRPEPTLLVRIRERRHTLSWIALAVLLPLMLLAVFAVSMDRGISFTRTEPTTVVTTPVAKPVQTAVAPPPPATVAMPVFDVKSLPTAPAPAKRGR
jgi:hypothetical protein